MKDILIVLENQVPFIIALVIGVIGHTWAGATKHKADFDKKKMLDGAFKFTSILAVILLVIIGINVYQPLYIKFAEEMETLQEVIVIGVYAKVIILVKEYFDVKDEDIKNYLDTRNYGEDDNG